MESLRGKKAHIVAGLLAIVGVVKMLTGDTSGLMEVIQNADLFLEASGLSAIRAGIAKVAEQIAVSKGYVGDGMDGG